MSGSATLLPTRSDANERGAEASFRQIRVARTTDRLAEITKFYRDGLGLPVIGHFEGHAGYSGIMFGTPTAAFHLEFTHAVGGSPAAASNNDDLLVFYVIDEQTYNAMVRRMSDFGFQVVAPENPYWREASVVFVDPDGWHIVLHHGEAFAQREPRGAAPDRPKE